MANLPYIVKDLYWLADSRTVLSGFPKAVKIEIGVALRLIQNGEMPKISKPLKHIGSGIHEIRASHTGNTFRTVYIAKLKNAVYVLDSFQKKSKKGKAIPANIVNRIKRRLGEAKALDKGARK